MFVLFLLVILEFIEHKHSKIKGEVFPELLLLVIKSMLYAQITFKHEIF
jgi:hypothetical protein